MMIRLETERLILRNYEMTDLEDIKEYFGNEEVALYEDFDAMSEQEVKEQIEEWLGQDNRMVAELKDSHKVIGSCGYFVDEDGDYSIDYDFNPAYQKMGYAAEGAQEIVRHLFEEIGVEKIFGDCDVRNTASYRLMERLGFERIERLENESYKDDEDGNEILIDIYLYILRKEQYKQMHK